MKHFWLGKIIPVVLLFTFAFLLRTYKLSWAGINPDEDVWHRRNDNFISAVKEGNWFYTQQSWHPGVSLQWLAAGGRVLLGEASSIEGDFWKNYWPRHRAMVLPIVCVTSLAVAGGYLLLLQLTSPFVSFLASLLLSLDPFFLAHSRVVQMDALLASFMILSILLLLVFVKKKEKIYLLFSAFLGGLAVLTKIPAVNLALYSCLVLGLSCCFFGGSLRFTSQKFRLFLRNWLLWCLVCGLTFTLFYPAMWVKPFLILKNIVYRLAGGGITAGSPGMSAVTFYLGKLVPAAGVFFYPLVFIFRTTPAALVFGFLSLFLLLFRWLKTRRTLSWQFFIFCFVFFYTLQMSLIAKKGDRYILPSLVGWNVLVAWGIGKTVDFIAQKLVLRKGLVQILAGATVLGTSLLLLVPLESSYLSFYNPLVGGGNTASSLMVVGWGEGMRKVGNWLNQQSDSEHLSVASFYHDTLQPYFRGEVWELGEFGDQDADYVVLYKNQVQRRKEEKYVEKYYQSREPVFVSTINGIDYAWVYEKK